MAALKDFADPLALDFPTGVGAGLVVGAVNNTVFGVSPDIDTADARGTIWDLKNTLRTRLYSPVQFQVRSSSANDTAAGTGARVVVITTLDGSFNEVVSVIPLNGVTNVVLPGTHLIVNAAVVVSTGSNHKNVGNITIDTVVGGFVQGYIASGKCLHRGAFFCVPAGKIFVAHNFFFTVSSGGVGTLIMDPVIILADGTELTALTISVTEAGPISTTVPDGFVVAATQTVEYDYVSVTSNNTTFSVGVTGSVLNLV